ncbi:MAG: hypothetical protein E6R13_02305 [Spirochaetes bacterium]|nr:MAG: hypothetical protein E6R13_02305 [Spirochaetota bacterium]
MNKFLKYYLLIFTLLFSGLAEASSYSSSRSSYSSSRSSYSSYSSKSSYSSYNSVKSYNSAYDSSKRISGSSLKSVTADKKSSISNYAINNSKSADNVKSNLKLTTDDKIKSISLYGKSNNSANSKPTLLTNTSTSRINNINSYVAKNSPPKIAAIDNSPSEGSMYYRNNVKLSDNRYKKSVETVVVRYNDNSIASNLVLLHFLDSSSRSNVNNVKGKTFVGKATIKDQLAISNYCKTVTGKSYYDLIKSSYN